MTLFIRKYAPAVISITLCLLLQSLLMVLVIRYYARRLHHVESGTLWTSLIMVSSVMMFLVLGNLAQLSIWAGFFLFLGEFSNFHDAVYHSAVNFATLGYGDIVMSEEHRILGPLEAINGVLMIGVSTAALTATFQDVVKRKLTNSK